MYHFCYYPKLKNSTINHIHLFSDDTKLLAISFDKNISSVKKALGITNLTNRKSKIISLAIKQLDLYFKGKLRRFTVPVKLDGTKFQVNAWKGLLKIPYGKVIDYKTQSKIINNPKAARAVGSANGKNLLPIIIPCHRVVPSKYVNNPMLNCGGYSAGAGIKKYLLSLESTSK